jgi:hypothetical protein
VEDLRAVVVDLPVAGADLLVEEESPQAAADLLAAEVDLLAVEVDLPAAAAAAAGVDPRSHSECRGQ